MHNKTGGRGRRGEKRGEEGKRGREEEGRRGEKRGEEGERGIGLPNGMKAANEQQASEQLYC